jgi:hypothetical protein
MTDRCHLCLAIMCSEDPSNNILVDADSKRFVDLLRDSKVAKARVAAND